MPDRFAFYDPLPRFDRDEDGQPMYETVEAETDNAPEIETPDAPVCPRLYALVMAAETVYEVQAANRAHERGCPVCGIAGQERRAA